MIPIVLTAFGTTADALATYAEIDGAIRKSFPDEEIIWAYSSRMVTRTLQSREKQPVLHLEEALGQLAARGITRAVVQSLHLFPGTEFHRLVAITEKSGIKCGVGTPLFTTPEDYDRLGRILVPVAGDRTGQAILILGHGTGHPVWTAYYALEKILRRRFGNRLFVGVVEKYPDSSHLPDEIAASGFSEAMIIPLFLVSGMHVQRDIFGSGEGKVSWMARLHEKNIAATCFHHGLGLLPGMTDLVVSHIAAAQEKLLLAE